MTAEVNGGFAAPGRPGDQDVEAVRSYGDGRPVRTCSDGDQVLVQPAMRPGQVVGDQFVDQLGDPLPGLSLRHEGGELTNGGDRIGHGHGAFAAVEK